MQCFWELAEAILFINHNDNHNDNYHTDGKDKVKVMVKVWLYLTINRCHQFSLASVVAEFAKVDALPSAEIQSMVRDGNGERNTHER